MKKIYINGTNYVELSDLEWILRHVRKEAMSHDPYRPITARDACDQIIRQVFIEEIRKAKGQEEIDAIMEMPGDFVVAHRTGKHQSEFFCGWKDREPMIGKGDEAMVFDYESKAEEIRDKLIEMTGLDWTVCDLSPMEYEYHKRLLDAIFGEAEEHE